VEERDVELYLELPDALAEGGRRERETDRAAAWKLSRRAASAQKAFQGQGYDRLFINST
jgi:hypothetical protein